MVTLKNNRRYINDLRCSSSYIMIIDGDEAPDAINRVPPHTVGAGRVRAGLQFYNIMEELDCGGGIYAAHI